MINRRINTLCYIVLIFAVKIRFILGAQDVTNSTTTSSNQTSTPSSVQARFSDFGAMGFPNFGAGIFGNPTSNYPTDSFFPFGNQNNNMRRPGMGYPHQNQNQGNFQNRPNQGGYPNQDYPYQGDSMNPNPNYQRPYPNGPNGNQGNFPNGPSHGGFGNRPGNGGFGIRPVHGGFGNQNSFPYQGDSMDRYPNYQRPPYPNRPNNVYPGSLNRPYQNGGVPPSQVHPGQFQRPPQDTQYPSQGHFQGQYFQPDQTQNTNFQPDDINNLPNQNINFPNKPYQNDPNQIGLHTQPIQSNPNFGANINQPGSSQPYPSNFNPNIQYPADNSAGDNSAGDNSAGDNSAGDNSAGDNSAGDNSAGDNGDQSSIRFPSSGANPGDTNQPSLRPDNFNNQNMPQSPNNQVMNPINSPDYNNTVAILGKPVIVPPITTPPGQIVFDSSTESPTMKKCVQDCQATSEYNPVCGSNNVTYVNPGKFVCARNCGTVVYVKRKGRCDGDAGFI